MTRTFRTLTMLAAVAAVALTALSLAGAGQAFNSNDCQNMYSLTLERTAPFYIEAGRVDFGDHMHIGGIPRGDAVICWSTDGRVGLKGVVFSDPGVSWNPPNQYATARIWFFDANAGIWRNQGSFDTPGGVQNSLQSRSVGGLDGLRSPAGNFTQVRIRLSVTTEGGLGGLITNNVVTRTYTR